MQANEPPRESMSARAAVISRSSSSVSASTAYEPASGSTVSVSPVSNATICWVRNASVAAASVGTPRASSYAHTCMVCTPPKAAATASTEVRTTLLSGWAAVSEEPAVNTKIRSCDERGSEAPCRPCTSPAPTPRARPHPAGGAELRHLGQEVHRRGQEREQSRRHHVDRHPASDHRVQVGDRVRERERDLVHRARSGLPDVVAAHCQRHPGRDLSAYVLDRVDGQVQRRLRREDLGAARGELL